MKILIAEDNQDTREEIAEILKAEGIEVIQANDGLDAFEKIKEEEYVDLVISDIRMPKMTGYELIGKIKKELRVEIPFIFITGSSIDEKELNVLNATGMECIRKPPDVNYLLMRIKENINEIQTKNAKKRLEKSLASIGAVKEELTILFADIEGYTLRSEEMHPDEIVVMVNDCLEIMSRVAMNKNGVVDKFIGDEMMVVYGGRTKHEISYRVEEAIETALEIKKEIREYNNDKNWPLIINVGICNGEVFSCALGNRRYKEWTVIGNAVNIASRLCAGAKEGQVFIDKDTYINKTHAIFRKKVEVKGDYSMRVKNTNVNYYEIIEVKD